jgi:transcriptional regulator with XRE-family HTH domain
MEVATLIKDSRRAAGMTQLQLANRAGTTQPAVAAYESGARTPTLATLERLLDACEHDLELLARPRVRRGAASLAQLAQTMAEDLGQGGERDALRLLFGFADDFRASSRPGRIALLHEEPPPTGDARFDATLAGAAEFFAREESIPAPPRG